jgi:hypothetical protein
MAETPIFFKRFYIGCKRSKDTLCWYTTDKSDYRNHKIIGIEYVPDKDKLQNHVLKFFFLSIMVYVVWVY